MGTLTPVSAESWNHRLAGHLLRRAGFGLPVSRVTALAGMTPEAAVTSLVDYEPGPHPARPAFVLEPVTRADIKEQNPGLEFAELQLLYQEKQREERAAVADLQAWWLSRMFTTANPLEEKMTLFWHGHFATSAQKVKASYHNHQLYEIFRRNATGNLKDLTICVGQSPAMLEYLDNKASSLKKPNENWARELMELFTMGVGNYTEDDIKASARAFTGWTCNRKEFTFAESRHDTGEKTFLGRSGNFNGWDIINIIFEQPVTAQFIAGKVWDFFTGVPRNAEVIDALAATLREKNYELRPMLRQLFLSEAFYSDAVIGAQVKSPVQYVLQLCADLDLQPPYPALARALRGLGQDLFYPPNVKGWEGNRTWINANSLLIRTNLPAIVVNPDGPGQPPDSDTMMGAMIPMGKGKSMSLDAGGPQPTLEDRKAYKRTAHAEAMEKIRALPKEERPAKVDRLKNGTNDERLALLKELGVALPPWHKAGPAALFDSMHFTTAGECLAQLSVRFLAVTPGSAQQRGLFEIIGAADASASLTPKDLDEHKRLALLRLVTSTAEYQVC